MKPVYLEGRQTVGDMLRNVQPSKMIGSFTPEQLKLNLTMPKKAKVLARDDSQRTKSRKSKSKKSQSREGSKKPLKKTAKKGDRSKSKKKEPKKWLKEEDNITEQTLKDIKEQLQIYQDKTKDKDLEAKKVKQALVASELVTLTRDKNSARLAYDTEKLRWKEEKGRLNEEILGTCVLAGQLDIKIDENESSVRNFSTELQELIAKLKEKSQQFDEVNSKNVILEGEMVRVGCPSMEKFDRDHFTSSCKRTAEMAEYESKKTTTLESKIQLAKTRMTEMKARIANLKQEAQEVVSIYEVQKRGRTSRADVGIRI